MEGRWAERHRLREDVFKRLKTLEHFYRLSNGVS